MKYENIKCGFKAYGKWTCFDDEYEFRDYLLKWVTEGDERDRTIRAVAALVNLDNGVIFTNTDV